MDRNANSIMNRIYQGSWRDSLPPSNPRIGVGEPLKNMGNTWNDAWEKQIKYSEISNTISKIMQKSKEEIKPFPLETIHSFFDKIEDWVAINGHLLTFPPSQKAWNLAVKSSIEKKDLEMCLLLSAAFPTDFSTVINSLDFENNVTKWFKTSVPEVKEENIIQEKEELSQILKKEVLKKQQEQEYSPEPKEIKKDVLKVPPKDYLLTSQEEKCLTWINNILTEVKEKNLPIGVELNNMDERIKKRKLTAGELYFDIDLFGAIIKLSKEDLKILGNIWPSYQKIPVYDSLAFLSSPKFWKGLNSTKENKDFIIENVLPIMLDITKLPFSNKYQIGKEILQNTTKSPELFMQRLNLWLNIGGDLLEQPSIAVSFNHDSEDFDDFSAQQEESPNLLNWIINQKNDMWISEVHNLLKNKGFVIQIIEDAYEKISPKNDSPKIKI